jgi:cell division protein FtsL
VIAQRHLAEPRSRSSGTARPSLRAVPNRRPGRRRARFVFVAAVVVGVLVFGVVALQAIMAETSFRMQDLTQRGVELRQSQGELRLEIAELTSPRRIAERAKALGLHVPDGVRTLRVRSTDHGEEGPGETAASATGGGSP